MKKSNLILNFRLYFFAGLLLAIFLVWSVVLIRPLGNYLEVDFLDIGQGDATLIQTSSSNQILIDGGPDASILPQLGRLLPFYDRSIDLIILTHPQMDHLVGLIDVLKRYRVGRILSTGVLYNSPAYDEWNKIIQEKKIPMTIARRGQKISLGSGVFMDILSPETDSLGKLFSNDVNDTSVVARVSYGKNYFLFTGDIEFSIENKLAEMSDITLASDVLKVAHHGSKTSSSERFLTVSHPKIAIIEVGRDNRYGHPTWEVLSRLEKFGSKIFRTDLDGTVRIFSNGKELFVQTQN